jgi:FixJ family two-component response regulator
MPHITGIEFFETLCKTHPTIVRVLLTGCSDLNVVVDSVNRGQIYKYLYKPMDVALVRQVIELAYEKFLEDKKNQMEVVQLIETNEKLEFMLRQKLID